MQDPKHLAVFAEGKCVRGRMNHGSTVLHPGRCLSDLSQVQQALGVTEAAGPVAPDEQRRKSSLKQNQRSQG